MAGSPQTLDYDLTRISDGEKLYLHRELMGFRVGDAAAHHGVSQAEWRAMEHDRQAVPLELASNSVMPHRGMLVAAARYGGAAELAALCRIARRRAGMTAGDVARGCGCSRVALWKRERGTGRVFDLVAFWVERGFTFPGRQGRVGYEPSVSRHPIT